MNAAYDDIRKELELIREELQSRLQKEKASYYTEMSEELFGVVREEERKKKTVLHHIQADLKDVEHALAKIDLGIYGICEDTHDVIPIEQLRIMPTARTIYEFSYERLTV
ncbi:molecular chaperone DnaK [Ectobacillus sp. JY-23]|uniref:TraR/DksA family transcriptional regulator n=1 Tax=Ectobacillus sp. JY-23 TaxID=2933872 RepID=UPI001FF2AF41|nr:molecular chaperone DnaK [Ectobacillus sp. JY-23]UOY93713.1 molecular chaperone DnaK [Ectobacillus sp. JY-23]